MNWRPGARSEKKLISLDVLALRSCVGSRDIFPTRKPGLWVFGLDASPFRGLNGGEARQPSGACWRRKPYVLPLLLLGLSNWIASPSQTLQEGARRVPSISQCSSCSEVMWLLQCPKCVTMAALGANKECDRPVLLYSPLKPVASDERIGRGRALRGVDNLQLHGDFPLAWVGCGGISGTTSSPNIPKTLELAREIVRGQAYINTEPAVPLLAIMSVFRSSRGS